MKKKILVAPLNWGLGHATRCIPIINALLKHNFDVLIASDGDALVLLKKEFPALKTIELPSYNISYSKNSKLLKLKLLKNLPYLSRVIKAEKRALEQIIFSHKINGVISDNRFGLYNSKVPCVYITHQLNVLSGSTSWLSTKIHQKTIKKFNECWIPDNKETPNLSGKLSHIKTNSLIIKYIGPLSRLNKLNIENTYDLMVLLSGPEPQRTMLEDKLLDKLKQLNGTVLFVKGKIENEQTITKKGNFTTYNFMQSKELETAINSSKIVLSRSGYTTVMDLAKIGKRAFFIPTPGQFEQEYLAKRFNDLNLVPCCNQNEFKTEMLTKVEDFKGLDINIETPNFNKLFSLF